VVALTAISLMSCSIPSRKGKVMAGVVTAHSFRSSISQRSHQPLVCESSWEWRAMLATIVAVLAVWADIFLFALL
jgi:hypothetical protein